MAEWHLESLRNELERNHWRVIEELDGNDYDISGVWEIARPDGTSARRIEFEGLDEMRTLPVAKSYSCRLQENHAVSLYFRRPGERWARELAAFVSQLGSDTT